MHEKVGTAIKWLLLVLLCLSFGAPSADGREMLLEATIGCGVFWLFIDWLEHRGR